MSLPNYNEILEHFGISKSNGEQMTVFDSKKIERIGESIAFCLAEEKSRAVIDYDPAYPRAVLRICTDIPGARHTKWIPVKVGIILNFKCENCGFTFMSSKIGNELFRYCPYCGAISDEPAIDDRR